MNLLEFVESQRSDLNTYQVDYIIKNWIERGKTPKQMRASFSKTMQGMQWQAKHGASQYRSANQAAVQLYQAVIAKIETEV